MNSNFHPTILTNFICFVYLCEILSSASFTVLFSLLFRISWNPHPQQQKCNKLNLLQPRRNCIKMDFYSQSGSIFSISNLLLWLQSGAISMKNYYSLWVSILDSPQLAIHYSVSKCILIYWNSNGKLSDWAYFSCLGTFKSYVVSILSYNIELSWIKNRKV